MLEYIGSNSILKMQSSALMFPLLMPGSACTESYLWSTASKPL
jgi:hypothetical protein